MINKDFIKILKCMFESGDRGVSPQDLAIYSHLFVMRQVSSNKNTSLVSNLEMMSSTIRFKLKGKSRDKTSEIRNSIIRLNEKGYINCMISDATKKKDILDISFDTVMNRNKNFVKLGYLIFNAFTETNKFYAYCFILAGEKYGKKISYTEFASKLNISDEKMRLIIKDLNRSDSDPRIYKFSGSYVEGSKKQEENIYYACLDSEKLGMYHNFYDNNGDAKYQKKKGSRKNTDTVFSLSSGEITILELKHHIQDSQWRKGTTKSIEYDDYELFKICERERIDVKFIDECKRRIHSYRDSVDYDERFEKYEETYQRNMIEVGIEIDHSYIVSSE